MRTRTCLTCGKTSNKRGDFYELTAPMGVGINTICKSCAKEIGIDGVFKAGFTSNTKALEKYAAIHPEAQIRLDEHKQLYNKAKDDFKEQTKEFKKKASGEVKGYIKKKEAEYNEAHKHDNHKKVIQYKCTCTSCGKVFHYDNVDVVKGLANAVNGLNGSLYAMNNIKNSNQCPNCNSSAVIRQKQILWFDKKGNFIEAEDIE